MALDDASDGHAPDGQLPGPVELTADPRRARLRREWVAEHCPTRVVSWYESLVVPADVPEGYATIALAQLVSELKTADAGTAKAILAEAEAIHAEPFDRIESAERRATTLQGTMAIAASAAVAGGGLLLNGGAIRGDGWRLAIALTLITGVLALLACAVRAVGVTGRMFQFEEPGTERIRLRARMTEPDALTLRAAELLRAADVADMIASVKVGLLRSAAWWFRSALILLALLATIVGAYVVAGPEPRTATPSAAASTSPGNQSQAAKGRQLGPFPKRRGPP